MNDTPQTQTPTVQIPREPPDVFDRIAAGDTTLTHYTNPVVSAIIVGAFDYLYPDTESAVFTAPVETIRSVVTELTSPNWYSIIGINIGADIPDHDTPTSPDVTQYGDMSDSAVDVFNDTTVTTVWTIDDTTATVAHTSDTHISQYQYHVPFTGAHLDIENITIDDLSPQTFAIILDNHVQTHLEHQLQNDTPTKRMYADMSLIAQAFYIHNTL